MAAEATAATLSHRHPPSGVCVAVRSQVRNRSRDRRTSSPGVTRTASSSTVEASLARRSSRNRTSSAGSEGTTRNFDSDGVASFPGSTGSSPIIPTSVCHVSVTAPSASVRPTPPTSPDTELCIAFHCNGAEVDGPTDAEGNGGFHRPDPVRRATGRIEHYRDLRRSRLPHDLIPKTTT